MGGTVTWTGADSSNPTHHDVAANWSAGAGGTAPPAADDHVIIPNVTHDPVMQDHDTWGSVHISSGGDLDGNGKTLTLNDGGQATIFQNLGTISGDLDVTITGGTSRAINEAGAGNIRTLTINNASSTFTQSYHLTVTTLTITAGTLDTDSSNHRNLTVTGGNISVSGTLLLNDSTVEVSDTSSALSISNVGTVTCGDTDLTVNALSLGQGTFTAPSASGSFIITGEKDGLAFDYDGNGFVHNSGTIEFKTQDTTLVDFTPNSAADIDINNVTINHASCIATLPSAGGIGGDLLITAGKFDCAGYDLTVGSITIASGAEFRASSGTTTISTGTIDNDGTLTHNKGTIKIDHDTGITLDLTGSDANVIPVYNLIVDTDNTVGYGACTIGNNLTKKGSGRMRPTGDSGRTIEVMGTLLIEAGTFGRGASDTHTNTFGNVVLTGGTIDLTGGGGSGKTIVKGAFRNVGGTVNTP
tara:strand:- start:1995 stop:3407 length:1413 start_codon:yes stop_codon:yes gene_type:complete